MAERYVISSGFAPVTPLQSTMYHEFAEKGRARGKKLLAQSNKNLIALLRNIKTLELVKFTTAARVTVRCIKHDHTIKTQLYFVRKHGKNVCCMCREGA